MIERAGRSPLAWLGGILALYLLVPIGYFLYRFAGSADRGFDQPGLVAAFVTSAETATISTAVIAVFGIPLAYWLGRSKGGLASVVGVLVQLPLALPPVMSGIVLIYVVGPYTPIGDFFDDRLTDSLTGVVLAQTFVAAPFLVIAARSAFATIEPAVLDIAATSGHRPLARFWKVCLPIAAGGIRAGLLLTWLRALGEYGATVLLAYHPYTLPVFTSVQFGSTGLPGTQAPTALALALAAAGLVLNVLHRPRRSHRRADVPEPAAPEPAPATTVAFDLDLTVGDFHLQLAHAARSHRIAILGASGSGKSMTLRAIAGLLGPHAGPVHFSGTDVTHVRTHRRDVGYVPQGHGLLPFRTVWRTLLFGVDSDPALASWWLSALRLDGLEQRLPAQLSGGQRQRVGLAQAMTRSPRVVLLDEPFSALDAPVRDELRREVRRLQRETGLSTVLVTHDPEEAALLADEIVVISDGRVLQAGATRELYARPAGPEVARLLGIENLVTSRVVAAGVVSLGSSRLPADTAGYAVGDEVRWCVRPEHVRLDPDGTVPGVVDDVADLGRVFAVSVTLDGGPVLRIRTSDAVLLDAGDPCRITIDATYLKVWRTGDVS